METKDAIDVEVNVVPETEADFAMAWADERKQRMILQTRLQGMMWDVVPVLGSVARLANNMVQIADPDPEVAKDVDIGRSYATVLMMLVDLEISMHLNLAYPASPNLEAPSIDDIKGLMEFPEDVMNRAQRVCQQAGKATYKEWDKKAEEDGFLKVDDLRQMRADQIKAALKLMTGDGKKTELHVVK